MDKDYVQFWYFNGEIFYLDDDHIHAMEAIDNDELFNKVIKDAEWENSFCEKHGLSNSRSLLYDEDFIEECGEPYDELMEAFLKRGAITVRCYGELAAIRCYNIRKDKDRLLALLLSEKDIFEKRDKLVVRDLTNESPIVSNSYLYFVHDILES